MDRRLTPAQLGQRSVVEDRLKTISAQLIAAHRRGDHHLVVPYARQAGLAVEGQPGHRLFMKTIQVYHPDRVAPLLDRIGRALAGGLSAEVALLTDLLEFHPEGPRTSRWPVDFEPEDFAETYAPETDADDPEDPWDEGEGGDWDPDEGTFYSAVKQALFGNLDLYPDAADLGRLEGELDLSGWDLSDLEGIEHCRRITSLNLSLNSIDNIYCLKDLTRLESLDLAENDLEDADHLIGLVNLQELDLSANDIDDVAFLDRLPRLRYVDLTGNPVRNRAVLARLEARGVVVIC